MTHCSDELKGQIVSRLSLFPIMNRSMIGVTLIAYDSRQLSSALQELLDDGIIIKQSYRSRRRQSFLFFLASNTEQIQPFIRTQK